tara:strand:+ start:3853 stop:4683 length:831 start_codon:yes stop_codon:yes gene_type:complete
MSDVTVILNFFNKPVDMLDMLMKDLQNQSIQPKYIWGCFLGCKDDTLIDAFLKWKDVFEHLYYIKSDYNFKYIGRYQLALTAPTDYVIVLDDDRFPKMDFIKKTRDILSKKECIIGQYGWVLNEKNMDINGLFVFPNWMVNRKFKGLYYNYNEIDLYSTNLVNLKSELTMPKDYAKNYLKYDSEDDSLLHIDYLCGGLSFRKTTLYKLFNEPFPSIETGEDIIFCLRAKQKGIPVYCVAPEYNELLFSNDRNISSTSSLTVLKKRTEIIRSFDCFK